PAGLAHRRLGLAAKPGHRLAHGARGQRGPLRREVRVASAAAAPLGRLSPGAGPLGILAGAPFAPARPPALSPGRRWALDPRTAGALDLSTRAPGSRRAHAIGEGLAKLVHFGGDDEGAVALV